MAKDKGLPAIFITFAALVLLVPFAWKFAPLLRKSFPTEKAITSAEIPASAVGSGTTVAPSTSARKLDTPYIGGTPSPAHSPTSLSLTDSDEERDADGPVTPTPSPKPPTLENVITFIDNYLTLGSSSKPPYAREDVINFPMSNFYGQPITHEEWIVRRGEFNRNAPVRYYTRIGQGLFTTSEDDTNFSAIIPIAYSLKQADGTTLEGISIDRIGATWTNGKLGITSHENLCSRVTRKNQVGIAPNAWRTGKIAPSRDRSTNLRYEDSDKSDSSILKSLPQGSPIQYLLENDRWLVVKDEEGIVGFVAATFISK